MGYYMMELNQAEHEHGTLESGATNDRHPRAWRAFGFFSKLIIVILLALAAASILLPFANRATLNNLSFLPLDWLLNQNGSWIAGAGLLTLLVLFVAIKRFQLVGDRRLWQDAGCPQCLEFELVRVPRKRGDRWYSLIALPAFRYACRNCTWQGLRISRRLTRPQPVTIPQVFAPAASDPSTGFTVPGFDDTVLAEAPSVEYADYADHPNGQFSSVYVFDVPENAEVEVNAIDADETAGKLEDDGFTAADEDMADMAPASDVDETWAPFDDEQLFDDEEPLSVESTDAIHQQPDSHSYEQPNNHKTSEQEDEFEWLWSRLDQDK